MSAPQFDIVFRGVRAGFDPVLVKSQFGNLFKLQPAKVEKIFKSNRVTLKNNADERLANIFVARLFAIGVVADKLPVEVIPSKAIYMQDHGEVSAESSSMHQPVDFVYGEDVRRIPFVFEGKGWEYFKIWLVNLLVCVASGGILYPWARVRSLRYMYGRTYLDDVEFSYTSNPQKIFLVQFVLMLYVAGLGYAFFFSPWLCLAGVIVLVAALPYYWLQRSYFRLQHSFYCDKHFHKKSDVLEAYKVFLLWPLVVVATVGIAAPYAIHKLHRYRVESISINNYEFSFATAIKPYTALLPGLLVAELLSVLCFLYRDYISTSFLILLMVGVWLQIFIRWRVALVNLQWNSVATRFGYFVATWEVPGYNKLITRNLLLCLFTLGLYWPWAKVNVAKYKASHLAFFANQRFKKWRKSMEGQLSNS